MTKQFTPSHCVGGRGEALARMAERPRTAQKNIMPAWTSKIKVNRGCLFAILQRRELWSCEGMIDKRRRKIGFSESGVIPIVLNTDGMRCVSLSGHSGHESGHRCVEHSAKKTFVSQKRLSTLPFTHIITGSCSTGESHVTILLVVHVLLLPSLQLHLWKKSELWRRQGNAPCRL
jgi:hypothetical protein